MLLPKEYHQWKHLEKLFIRIWRKHSTFLMFLFAFLLASMDCYWALLSHERSSNCTPILDTYLVVFALVICSYWILWYSSSILAMLYSMIQNYYGKFICCSVLHIRCISEEIRYTIPKKCICFKVVVGRSMLSYFIVLLGETSECCLDKTHFK